MKITKERLNKAIDEEVRNYLKEMKGPFAKQLKQAAQGDAYRDHLSSTDNSGAAAAADQKEKAFQSAHKSQLASKEGLPDWMLEEEEEDDGLGGPTTSGELTSQHLYDVMWRPLERFVRQNMKNSSPQRITDIELNVEDKLLDIAMLVRGALQRK